MTGIQSGIIQRHKLLLLLSLPVIFLVVLISVQAVNVPNMDQWELVPIIEHLHSGHLTLNDFWWQHNEHRIFFPLLIMLGSAVITHWNTVAECFIGLIIAIFSFAIVLSALTKTNKKIPVRNKTTYLLPFLIGLIWFSPVQAENWLWGWQMQWFMNVLGVAGMVWVIARIKKSVLSWSDLIILLCSGIFAQYSLGNGSLVWPIATVVLLYRRVEFKKILSVIVTGLIATGLFYRHYINPSKTSETLAAHHPLSYLYYVFSYLGRPLVFFHKLAPIFGVLLLLIFLSFSVYLYMRERKRFDILIPWIAMGIYVIGSGFMTGAARLSYGQAQALSSRYTTISSLLLVATIVMLFNSRDIIKKIINRDTKIFELLTVAVIFLLVLANMAWGIRNGNIQNRDLQTIYQCTHQQNPTSGCLLSTYPRIEVVTPRLEYLKQIHWGGY